MIPFPSGWQIVQGSWGWFLIEQCPDGVWLQRAGPYLTRNAARDPILSEQYLEPTGAPHMLRPSIAYGQHNWYVVTRTDSRFWAQLAGPFECRDDARDWLWNSRSSHQSL